jgi:hypothetical protein
LGATSGGRQWGGGGPSRDNQRSTAVIKVPREDAGPPSVTKATATAFVPLLPLSLSGPAPAEIPGRRMRDGSRDSPAPGGRGSERSGVPNPPSPPCALVTKATGRGSGAGRPHCACVRTLALATPGLFPRAGWGREATPHAHAWTPPLPLPLRPGGRGILSPTAERMRAGCGNRLKPEWGWPGRRGEGGLPEVPAVAMTTARAGRGLGEAGCLRACAGGGMAAGVPPRAPSGDSAGLGRGRRRGCSKGDGRDKGDTRGGAAPSAARPAGVGGHGARNSEAKGTLVGTRDTFVPCLPAPTPSPSSGPVGHCGLGLGHQGGPRRRRPCAGQRCHVPKGLATFIWGREAPAASGAALSSPLSATPRATCPLVPLGKEERNE